MTSSTFNFRIELGDKDCNEKSYDVVKNKSTPQLRQQQQVQQTKLQEQKQKIKELKGLAISIDYINSRSLKIEGDVIKNTEYARSEGIEGSYRCIEIRFDDKQILALRNISDKKYVPEGQVVVGDASRPTVLNISDEKVFKIIRIDRGRGDWHEEYQGFDKICKIEGTSEVGRQQEEQQVQEQQPKPQELKPEEQQLNKDILQEEQQVQEQQVQEQQPMQQEVQEKSQDTYERDAITDDQGRKKYKTFYYESK